MPKKEKVEEVKKEEDSGQGRRPSARAELATMAVTYDMPEVLENLGIKVYPKKDKKQSPEK